MVTKNKELEVNEIKTKLGSLESADVFLQETSRLAMEKIVSLEKRIDELMKGNSNIEKHQENSIKTVDELKRDISDEKLRVNSLEIFMKNCQDQRLDDAVETRIAALDEGYKNVLKETVSLRETIEHITEIAQELKNKEQINLTNYQDKTEAHEAKLETLEKYMKDLQRVEGSHNKPPLPGGQTKTEQREFISKKIEEQKRTLELFFKSIEERVKKVETIHNQEIQEQEHEPKMNEYDIIETHGDDEDDLEETNHGENTTKTVEREVLLQMTNIDSKHIKLGSNKQEDFKKPGFKLSGLQSRKLNFWLKKRKKAFCCSCLSKQPSVLNMGKLYQAET